ncbi:MAG: hypothetical protein RLZZ354_292 [Pseudomonadota bacterium]|jgi:hypothetical protein
MNFPTSSIGLPQSLKYDLPPSMSDSARAYSVNVSPDGITMVTGPASSAIPFALNGQTAAGAFNSQIVSFTIPSGMSQSVFLDPYSTTLSFTLIYKVVTASAGGSGQAMTLQGSAASFFDTLVLYSNNTPIETINSYGVLQNFLIQNSVNFAERYGGLSVCMGTDTNTTNGLDLAWGGAVNVEYRYNFTIPLLSVIGANYDKLFPVGSINNLQLQMTTANLLPISSWATTTAPTTVPVFTFQLSEFTLNMKYIDIGDMASQILNQTLQDGKWFLKANTYTNSAVTIPANTSGNQQLLLQIRNTSVKSILHTFAIPTSAQSPNGQYDSICPNLTSRQCQVGGQFYPNKPLNDAARPSEGYSYLIQSLAQGGGITKSYGTVINRYSYCCIISAVTGQDSTFTVPAAGKRIQPQNGDVAAAELNIINFPNAFYCGYDLEKSSGVLFQGVNTRASPPFLNLFIATGLPNNVPVSVNAWGLSDVILQVDTIAKQITAFI